MPTRRDGTLDLNVVLLPDPASEAIIRRISKLLAQDFSCSFVLGERALAHATIYQTKYRAACRQDILQNVKMIAAAHRPLTLTTAKVSLPVANFDSPLSHYIFWNIARNSLLTNLHRDIVDSLVRFRSLELLPVHRDMLEDERIPLGMRRSLEVYGTLLAKETEQPHFTLTHVEHLEDVPQTLTRTRSLLPATPLELHFDHVHVVRVGHYGTATKIIAEFPLGTVKEK